MKSDTAPARRPHAGPRIVSPRNKVTVAFPLSMIRAEKPATMDTGDWISLARLIVSVIGFSIAIRQLGRIANASHAGQEDRQADRERGVQAERRGVADRDAGTPEDGGRPGHSPRAGANA